MNLRTLALCCTLLASLAPAQTSTTTQETLHTPTGTVETGSMANAAYRIDIPTNWNHSLVVFYHGYSHVPYLFTASSHLNGQAQPMFDRGYAILEDGYSDTGWAIEQAIPETDQLRTYFVSKYGKPKETFAAGASMGGALTMITMEQKPDIYNGGLALCARLGPTDIPMQLRFAIRAAFDFYFPGLMPPLVPSPPDYQETPELRAKVKAALISNPDSAAKLRNLMHLHNDTDVANMIVYYTYIVTDFQKKAGGNPFDNRNFIYTGTGLENTDSDNALNDGVKRYAADPFARQYLIRNYTPTGKLLRPMLALHTTYDQLIPPAGIAIYDQEVAATGNSANYVQQYVHRDGHCTMSPEEVGRSFDELLLWVHTGKAPTSGILP